MSQKSSVLIHYLLEVPSTLAQSIVIVEKNERGPSMSEVQKVLRKNNIQAQTREMVFELISSISYPLVDFHRFC
jgi:hypothetical protein